MRSVCECVGFGCRCVWTGMCVLACLVMGEWNGVGVGVWPAWRHEVVGGLERCACMPRCPWPERGCKCLYAWVGRVPHMHIALPAATPPSEAHIHVAAAALLVGGAVLAIQRHVALAPSQLRHLGRAAQQLHQLQRSTAWRSAAWGGRELGADVGSSALQREFVAGCYHVGCSNICCYDATGHSAPYTWPSLSTPLAYPSPPSSPPTWSSGLGGSCMAPMSDCSHPRMRVSWGEGRGSFGSLTASSKSEGTARGHVRVD